ncbi:camphor resistance protein CrcB [Lentilactobacillus curieae]|uniref:Fluoride-specific ion channel FluC n=1 Tax=Lentilactobacillus curieae TaxID=1138822 RepID=A0A1S6QIY3_9LACO|nr:CrcB family protein [Lentilactobacillus curieae]AQW21565.1 camphor resistance protein CrcB [Lentilactobacillus curieae]
MDELLIAIFAILGGMARFGVDAIIPTTTFPLATVIINLIGCFVLALINNTLAVSERFPAQLTLALGTGMIGAFTTFSTFTVEIIKLLQSHEVVTAGMYLLVSIIGGIFLAYLGSILGKKITTLKAGGNHR